MSQLTYSLDHQPAYEGTRADSRPMRAFAARNATVGEIPYGRAVVFAAAAGDGQAARLPSATSDKILGVALHDMAHNPSNVSGVLPDDMFTVISGGGVYVKTEQAVTPADKVFVRFTAGSGGEPVGGFRKDADTDKAVELPNARWSKSGAAGTIVALELGLP